VTIPDEYRGWWRIVETSQWDDDHLDLLGPAMFSISGRGDRWRMIALLADVDWRAAKSGLRFSLNGAWEFDPTSATGTVKLEKDGRLKGTFRIKHGDSSTFIAERTVAPSSPIPAAPNYRDKWRRW
jgi:hypothetical protein